MTTESRDRLKTKKEIKIRNKHFKEEPEPEKKPVTPGPKETVRPVIVPVNQSLEEQETLPSLETVIQDFIDEAKSLEERTSPEKAVTINDSNPATVVPEPAILKPEPVKAKPVPVKNEKRKSLSPVTGNPCNLLKRKTVIPKVQYRWQKGFRKATNSSSSSYIRVPILKVTLDFDPKTNPEPLLPKELTARVLESNLPPKVVRVFQGRARLEFQLPDDSDFTVQAAVDSSVTGLDSVASGLQFTGKSLAVTGLERWTETPCRELEESELSPTVAGMKR